MRFQLLLISLLVFFSNTPSASAQDYECPNCITESDFDRLKFIIFQDSIVVRDTIRDTVFVGSSSIQELSQNLNLSYTDFVENFLDYVRAQKAIDGRDKKYDEFMKDYVAKIYNEIYRGQYIYQTYWIDKNSDNILKKREKHPQLALLPDAAILEFVFVQHGADHTQNFLNTKNEQIRLIEAIFKDIRALPNEENKEIAINFYLPDFDFENKRSLFQFVKSVSLAIESIKVQEIRDVKLYFSFNTHKVEDYTTYIVGLYEMIDGVYSVELGTGVRKYVKPEDLSSFYKIRNQFLFARFELADFPEIKENDISYSTIYKLVTTDYPELWEEYFFAILGIVFLLFVFALCYILIPRFSDYINQNYLYALAVSIIMGAELIIMFIYMVEEMGSKTKIITLKDIILFQLLLVFALPLVIRFFKRKDIP